MISSRKGLRPVRKSRKSPGGRKLAAAMRGVSLDELNQLEAQHARKQKEDLLAKLIAEENKNVQVSSN